MARPTEEQVDALVRVCLRILPELVSERIRTEGRDSEPSPLEDEFLAALEPFLDESDEGF